MASMRAVLPYASMVAVQLAYAGSNILSKIALDSGLSFVVFIVYRHLISIFILGFLSLLFERKQTRSLSWSVVWKIFLLALFGVTIHQNVYYAGLEYASATVASALGNVIPALTFLLAVLLRMEKFEIKSAKGRAKIIGTLTCIGGALVFTFWKGYLFNGIFNKAVIVVKHNDKVLHGGGKDDWIRGSSLILTSHVAYSAWLILQAKVCEIYKAKLWMNTLVCFFALVQSSILVLIFERSTTPWRLEWNIQLFTIIYCGVVISGMVYYLQTWCIGEKGPVFVAMFCPLLLVIVAIFSALFLAERLHLGSVVGAVLIVSGVYCFLWGKHDAQDNKDESNSSSYTLQKMSVIDEPKATLPIKSTSCG